MDIYKDKYGYKKITWDIFAGYLFWDTFSNHILIIKRYPIISYHILPYPFISYNILGGELPDDANVIQCLPIAANASNRCVLNIQVFASCYEACLNEFTAIFCADLMDTRASFENFQHKIKTIYDKRINASEWCKELRYLTESANEMIFGVYRAALQHFSNPKIRDVEDVLWKFFPTLVFHNHFH
jgi:hypothetical protein